MITHNLFLALPDAAIFLDISLSRLQQIIQNQYKTLTLQQIDAIGRHLSGQVPGNEEQKIVCLMTPPCGWRKSFAAAAKPAKLPVAMLDQAEFYMTEAPFLSSVIEILHWLNQSGFYKRESIHVMAQNLSNQGAFRLFTVPKGDKIYRKYYAKLMNPPVLEVTPIC